MNTVLLVAACACLVSAIAWEIAKALAAPAMERRRKRISEVPGFPVILRPPEGETPENKGDAE